MSQVKPSTYSVLMGCNGEGIAITGGHIEGLMLGGRKRREA